MECNICKLCLQNCVEPCLGDNWKKSKGNQRNSSSSNCVPCKSGRLIKCSICRIDLNMSSQEIQKLPFEDMMKYLQIAHSRQKQGSVSQSYKSPKISPKSSSCPADLNMSNQEFQKLPNEDMTKYLQIAYSKQKPNSVPHSYISPTNSLSNSLNNSPKYSPIMGARKFLMNCFSPNNSPKHSPKNSPRNTRNPLHTIQEYERHDLVLYNVNNKYTCTV